MGAGAFRRPHDPCEPNVGFEMMIASANNFLHGILRVRKKNRFAGCGHAGVRDAY